MSVGFSSQIVRITISGIVTLLVALGASSSPACAESGETEAQSNYADAVPLTTDGCNSASRAPIPGTGDLFIARHYIDKSGALLSDVCGSASLKDQNYGLVLEHLDWSKKEFFVVKPLLPVPLTVGGDGPFEGLIITAAFDPDIVVYHGHYLVSFECGFRNARKFGVRGQASCMAPFDFSKKEIDPDKVYVVASGDHDDFKKEMYSASVPTLLVADDRLYIYWSVLTVNIAPGADHLKFLSSSVRGAELVNDGKGYFWVKNAKGMAYVTDPKKTVEVWGPDKSNPMSDISVDIKSLWTHGDEIVAVASLGGGKCTRPNIDIRGCYRMVIAKATQPLGYHVFNNSSILDGANLPTNPVDYVQPIKDPQGNYFLLGWFHYPHKNGYSELRIMPPQNDWPSDVTLDKWQNAYQAVAFPLEDRDLWPTSKNVPHTRKPPRRRASGKDNKQSPAL